MYKKITDYNIFGGLMWVFNIGVQYVKAATSEKFRKRVYSFLGRFFGFFYTQKTETL